MCLHPIHHEMNRSCVLINQASFCGHGEQSSYRDEERWRPQPEHLGEVERLGVVDVEDLNGKQNEVWND